MKRGQSRAGLGLPHIGFLSVNLPRAACRGRDPILWTEPDSTSTGGTRGDMDPARVRLAKEICGQCPERIPCGLWAIDNAEVGIWGGMTTRERQVIREQVSTADRGRRDCTDCDDIRHFRACGLNWVEVSRRLGRDDSWALIHARRHDLPERRRNAA